MGAIFGQDKGVSYLVYSDPINEPSLCNLAIYCI
jgi:hypothetical protein